MKHLVDEIRLVSWMQASLTAGQVSSNSPTVTLVQLPNGQTVQVHGVIQAAQPSVIQSPQVQTVQVRTKEAVRELIFLVKLETFLFIFLSWFSDFNSCRKRRLSRVGRQRHRLSKEKGDSVQAAILQVSP